MNRLKLLCLVAALTFGKPAIAASSVSVFGVEFELPEGCVLYPRPSLIDREIRFECSTDLRAPHVTIRFEAPDDCAYEGKASSRLISESNTNGVSISVRAYRLSEDSDEIFVATLADEETCFSATSSDLQAVQSAIEPIVAQ